MREEDTSKISASNANEWLVQRPTHGDVAFHCVRHVKEKTGFRQIQIPFSRNKLTEAAESRSFYGDFYETCLCISSFDAVRVGCQRENTNSRALEGDRDHTTTHRTILLVKIRHFFSRSFRFIIRKF
jgi:hypothetical protein